MTFCAWRTGAFPGQFDQIKYHDDGSNPSLFCLNWIFRIELQVAIQL